MSDLYNEQDSVNEERNEEPKRESAPESSEEYRRAPYMREGGENTNRYAYDDENRYRSRTNDGGNGPKRGGGKVIAAVIAAAVVLGGIVGFTCWNVGSLVATRGAADGKAVIETAAPEELAQAKTATQAPEENQPVAADATSEAATGEAATEAVTEEAPTEAETTLAAETTSAAETSPVETETAEPTMAAATAGVAETMAATVSESEGQAADDGQVTLGSGDSQIETAELDESAATVKALDVTEVVDVAMPSVVAITTTAVYESYNNNTFDPFYYYFYGGYGNNYGYGDQGGSNQYQVTGAGSGIIIGDDGTDLWIVTNNHVVADADTLTVNFCDDSKVDATVLGTDPRNDLAVVGVKLADLSDDTKKVIKAVKMGDSDTLKLGETVIAIGNALGLGQSVSTGVVSALNREITTSEGTKLTTIQTDAAINPGNSGGALLDASGELIGINVAKDAETDVEGMGYAIPISSAKAIIERLTSLAGREAVSEDQYPFMGVQLQDIGSDVAQAYRMPEGILVYSIEDNSPAQQAGMLPQDIITGFNGVPVSTYEELTNELQYYAGGTAVTVTVQRLENGVYAEKELNMTLGLRKDYRDNSSAGTPDKEDSEKPEEGQQPENGGQQPQQPGGNSQQPGNSSFFGFDFGR